ncbi:ricin-type beta-trefoil lectin domain protein [Actinoplanes friuliensis]|jgi:streptogrisin C|uniref:Ricin b lectin n=1 Tax=Actinoplanes friuliensis DSM 7358 TaxID=1246995 RepID=U5W6S6_9ACTN|nr:ricin-type beta-trefoil lectin domain protein [Actinoplanes friuliensis]AGZ44908.1 ricin b lectin [Actinoplanes friuliensis DSM 7358]
MSRPVKVLGVIAVAVTAVGLSPFTSFAAETPEPAAPTAASTFDMAPGMAAAMRRDLKLTDDQIASRLATEAAAPVVEKRLRAQLGKTFAGAWIPSGSERLTVAVTDPKAAATVRAEGAEVKIVDRSAGDLEAARQRLDKNAAEAKGTAIRGWYVDVATNRVVVMAKPGTAAAARKFAKDSGAGTVTVVDAAEAPRPLYDIRGGDQYVINGNTLCSVGFSVAGGFVTAGHCGGVNSPTLGYNNVSQGTFAGSSFPGNDYAWVRTNGNWTPQPWVNNYAGGNVTVAGSQDAAIGSSVCRSGRTSGWRCGTILGRNETIVYSQGAVSGLSRSNACAEPGDSGGSWISGNQAQGVTSGGSGNCSSGGTMWFQPVNEILGVYGLSLTTTGGGSSGQSIVSNWNNKCLDVPNSNFSDGVLVQMWNCNNSGAQKWAAVNGTLQTSNNKCLDIPWGSTASGVELQIVGCNGNPAQQFVLSAAGDLVNPQANKCLDIKDWNGNDGARIQLWDCGGTLNQKWRRV